MRVIVNGEPSEIRDDSSVADLLDSLRIGRERVAVEVNRDIVPKARHDAHLLSDGDRIEIVHFVGGG
ncbi:MAG TPA: sulfur carrier protein ThiS [Desulfuromonadaceae bacterium]